MSSAPAPTPPVGEGGTLTLEERLRNLAVMLRGRSHSATIHDALMDASEELIRQRSEVARLTAEREDHGPDGRNVTNAQHFAMRERAQAAEERAGRAEEALAGERRIVRSLQEQLDEERRTFPAEGVWLVTDRPGDRHARRIAPVSALPDAVPLAELYLREDQVTRAVDALREEIMGTVQHDADGGVRWTYPAARDVARSILRALECRALTEGADRHV